MSNTGSLSTCSIVCWVIAALVGLFGFWAAIEPTSFVAALMVGLALAVFLGLVLTRLICAAGEAATPSGAEKEVATAAPSTVKETESAGGTIPETEKAEEPEEDDGGAQDAAEEGTRPEALQAARGGKADDLKQIKGVGPKLEAMLNGMGFYHFDQISAWSAEEVAWVDANLTGFRGRVSRDSWVDQAKVLAAGGETEFSKRVEDGDVY